MTKLRASNRKNLFNSSIEDKNQKVVFVFCFNDTIRFLVVNFFTQPITFLLVCLEVFKEKRVVHIKRNDIKTKEKDYPLPLLDVLKPKNIGGKYIQYFLH